MEMKMQTNNKPMRSINLFCPSLSTIAPLLASEEQCVDIGSIAALFGLDPSSVKLNGRFLSRGIDLVSSVTWRSLLSFFSNKRLPVGASLHDHHDAIVVDGKLSEIGLNRAHGPQDIVNGDCCEADEEDGNLNGHGGPRLKTGTNLLNNKKFKYTDLGSKHMECRINDNKRKQHMEAVILLKKLKLNETKSGFDELSDAGRGTISNAANVAPRSAYSCSYISKNMKRMREDETLVSTLCKKTRRTLPICP